MARAFTLVEILVVVAIITIIAAAVLPALKSARDKAKRANCVNNIRSIGLMAQLYADDNADLWPLDAGDSNNHLWNLDHWHHYGRLYNGNYSKGGTEIFFCPAATQWTSDNGTTGVQNLGVNGMNTRSSYWVRGTDDGAPLQRNDSASKVIVMDSFDVAAGIANHPTGVNVLYGDGVVEFKKGLPGSFSHTTALSWSHVDR